MEVEQLTMPKKKAEEEFEALKILLKDSKRAKVDEIYSDYQKLYGHLRHGKKVIDIYASFKKAGLNEQGDPKLAIVRADSKQVCCQKSSDGSVVYFHDRGNPRNFGNWSFWNRVRGDKDDVWLPARTFAWVEGQKFWGAEGRASTVVPIIPAKILVNEIKVLLKNFHIIWEVDEWKPIPPRDPILAKRLTPNMFAVLATWNLTKLERAIIRGRIS